MRAWLLSLIATAIPLGSKSGSGVLVSGRPAAFTDDNGHDVLRAAEVSPLVALDEGDYSDNQLLSWMHPTTRPDGDIGFVAFGDSYSAGIGTGLNGTEDPCRLGQHAHPRLIAADLEAARHLDGDGDRHNDASNATKTHIQFLSCTGAVSDDVLSGTKRGDGSQIDAFNTSVPIDFALLSLGGNDLGFFDVINACIFRFYSFYSGTCDEALSSASRQLESPEFEQKLEMVITEALDTVRWEKKPWFFVTVTGYAEFFNDETEACDDMSLGLWWNGPKLARQLRTAVNDLVSSANDKIKRTVDKVNAGFARDRLLFVDYDDKFVGHRFCEEGVQEPDYARNDTWFFLVGGPDNARDGTGGGDGENVTQLLYPSSLSDIVPSELMDPEETALVDPATCLEPARESGSWADLGLCYVAMAKERERQKSGSNSDDAAEAKDEQIVPYNSMWYVPTYYGKVFHPRSLGHEAMRDRIYEKWREWEDSPLTWRGLVQEKEDSGSSSPPGEL